jgi:hypothetical protein
MGESMIREAREKTVLYSSGKKSREPRKWFTVTPTPLSFDRIINEAA